MTQNALHKLRAQNDWRVGAIGKTGMGKTFLMEKLLKPQPRVIVVDSKHRVAWKGYYLTYDPTAALVGHDKVIYRPPEGTKVPNEWWMKAIHLLIDNGGGVLYVDEMAMITSSSWAPPGLLDAFRIGRELGAGVWWSTQEATGVANTVIRQSDVLIMFFNHGASDRDKLIGTAGDMAEITKNLAPYEFVVYEANGTYDADDIPILQAVAS